MNAGLKLSAGHRAGERSSAKATREEARVRDELVSPSNVGIAPPKEANQTESSAHDQRNTKSP
ncbi:hypothetical protein CBM2598_U20051 [Cupriavidus taiwanensis]|uniref:Uncharacterized protein n=1 Tax=Cupriavidus taiwanensis TaxID=164546 RepID=A0A7Z7JGA8_9BURK|nr:hypothetical protein CBM2597_U20046 [Cupriavidus taiwanensis]SOZ96763.1 hypothetical protein CBM2598_U20051 [Cupriavidus taiwanensis]SPC26051.1 hypothetical protein CBM2594_U30073 [Cupriavidus taiwanensis]